jgi:hypothetical protein
LNVNDENRKIRIRIRIHTKMSWIRNTGTEANKAPRVEEMLAYGVTALLLESVLNELVEQAGLPRTRRTDHQELEQVVVRIVHFFHSEIQTLG